MDQLTTITTVITTSPVWTYIILGIIYPWAQAALDKPWWTKQRRIALVTGFAIASTAILYAANSFTWPVEAITTHLTGFLGTAWAVYQLMAATKIGDGNLLDWVGVKTPGGATEMPTK